MLDQDESVGTRSNENNNDDANTSIKNNNRVSLGHAAIGKLSSKKKRGKRSRVVLHRLFQERRPRKGASSHDPFVDDATDEDASTPSNINPIDPFPGHAP